MCEDPTLHHQNVYRDSAAPWVRTKQADRRTSRLRIFMVDVMKTTITFNKDKQLRGFSSRNQRFWRVWTKSTGFSAQNLDPQRSCWSTGPVQEQLLYTDLAEISHTLMENQACVHIESNILFHEPRHEEGFSFSSVLFVEESSSLSSALVSLCSVNCEWTYRNPTPSWGRGQRTREQDQTSWM